ncbi:MAG: hypothetical protein ACYT04_61720, partial [Nostoc sp.]
MSQNSRKAMATPERKATIASYTSVVGRGDNFVAPIKKCLSTRWRLDDGHYKKLMLTFTLEIGQINYSTPDHAEK